MTYFIQRKYNIYLSNYWFEFIFENLINNINVTMKIKSIQILSLIFTYILLFTCHNNAFSSGT